MHLCPITVHRPVQEEAMFWGGERDAGGERRREEGGGGTDFNEIY